MQGRWHFNDLVAGLKIREAVQDEFFSADVIRGAAEAVIREGIQNSLDAAVEGQKVRVAISLGSLARNAELKLLQPFLDAGWEHFLASDNGLTDAPTADEPCRFLVFEDFGTSGLTGDPNQLLPIPDVENRFFHFYRVEGRSDKHEHDRGRWGVGKQVFPRASRIKSVFGLTVRADDKQRLLMGQAILRSHRVKSHRTGDIYYQDGWFGKRQSNDARPVYPLNDKETLETFQNTFQLARRDEPGLSLVVPYLQNEINDDELIAAVLRGYFYPIVMGDLQVLIRTGESRLELTADTITKKVEVMSADLRAEIQPVVNLAIWARNNDEPFPELGTPNAEAGPQWTNEIVPESIRALVREVLKTKEPLGLRVPVDVRPRARGKPRRPSYFDVLLVRDDKEASGRPIFIREGIIISDVRGHRSRGVRSLVVIESGSLATMLGDSENPAHTQWQKHGSKFKDKYYSGGSTIRFVADSVAEIVRISTEAEDQEDLSLLSDIFSIPAGEGEEGIEEADVKKKADDARKVEIPEPPGKSVIRFVVTPVEGGFTVKSSSPLSPLPAFVRVRIAYDVRRGNAFNKYDPADFRLEKMDVKISGAEILEQLENILKLQVLEENFSLAVRGFDPNRDVRISVIRLGDNQ